MTVVQGGLLLHKKQAKPTERQRERGNKKADRQSRSSKHQYTTVGRMVIKDVQYQCCVSMFDGGTLRKKEKLSHCLRRLKTGDTECHGSITGNVTGEKQTTVEITLDLNNCKHLKCNEMYLIDNTQIE